MLSQSIFNNDLNTGVELQWFDSVTNDHYRKLNIKKDALIKDKLIEKGFSHLIKRMTESKFPKICCIKKDEWSYFYADDDSTEGVFIVAIKDTCIGITSENFGSQLNFEFQWQDKLPIITHNTSK